MSKLFPPHVAVILLFASLLTSCEKDEKNCGGEDNVRYTVLSGNTAAQFANYTDYTTVGNASYRTKYERAGNYSNFLFQTVVVNVCPYEEALIIPTLILFIPNADVKDTLLVIETGGSSFIKEHITPANGVYQVNELFPFYNTNSGKTEYSVVNKISIPWQGSETADSLYFWGNVNDASLSTQYKVIQ